MKGRFITVLNARNARWMAWVFAGINILLMGTGLALQPESLSL